MYKLRKDSPMQRRDNKQATCNHCKGVLAHNGETYSCLMCGRDMDHKCERCIGLSARRKGSRKLSAA